MDSGLQDRIKKLSKHERIRLVEEIWDSIAEENESFDLSKNQKLELDSRIDSLKRKGLELRSWEEIRAEFIGR